MKKTILFDLDGTLTDSGEGIMNCAEFALNHFGLPVPSREELRIFVGPPLHDTFGKFGVPEDRVDEAVAVFRSRYTPIGVYENTPYPGIWELLETLQEQGHTLCVATSKPEIMANTVLDYFNMTHYFDKVCGALLDRSRISKSDVIAYLLKENGRADNMVMVGDTEFDVIGAAEHGIPTIGVGWGYGSVPEMEKAGAIAIANTCDELLQFLNRD